MGPSFPSPQPCSPLVALALPWWSQTQMGSGRGSWAAPEERAVGQRTLRVCLSLQAHTSLPFGEVTNCHSLTSDLKSVAFPDFPLVDKKDDPQRFTSLLEAGFWVLSCCEVGGRDQRQHGLGGPGDPRPLRPQHCPGDEFLDRAHQPGSGHALGAALPCCRRLPAQICAAYPARGPGPELPGMAGPGVGGGAGVCTDREPERRAAHLA